MRSIDVIPAENTSIGVFVARADDAFDQAGASAKGLTHRPANEPVSLTGPAAVRPSETKASSRPSPVPFLRLSREEPR